VLSLVNECSGAIFFLNGHVGVGKTYVYNTIATTLQSQGNFVICVASSSIVALIFASGQTTHSTFKLLIQINEYSMRVIDKTSQRAKKF
jgi:chromosomal replication initiation ATPase DnaA